MLEATIWEKVKQGASRRLWRSVAEDFYESAESEWPSSLCSFEHAQQIGVAVEIRALEERFRRLAKKKVKPKDLRAAALKIIQRAPYQMAGSCSAYRSVWVVLAVITVYTVEMGSGAVQESRGSSRSDDMASRGEVL